MANESVFGALNYLSECLFQYYGKKAIILLDEYDTPMQEAYIHGDRKSTRLNSSHT